MAQRRRRDLRYHILVKRHGSREWRHEATVPQREAVPAQLESTGLRGCMVKVVPSREDAEVVLDRVRSGEIP